MAYSSVPTTMLGHLIEVLQAACIKCQPQIPGIASATGESYAAIADHAAVRLNRSEHTSACHASVTVSSDQTPAVIALSGSISPMPEPVLAAASSLNSPHINHQEQHQAPDPAPALSPIESESCAGTKRAAPLVKPPIFSFLSAKMMSAGRSKSLQTISRAYSRQRCSIHIRGHPPPLIPMAARLAA